MISLGGIELPDGSGETGRIDWIDQYAYSPVATDIKRTIGGQIHYAQVGLEAGQPITLEAAEGGCWLSQLQKDSLIELAAALGPIVFSHDGTGYLVIFDHSNGSAEFRRKRINSDEFWYGTIKLISIGYQQ